MAVGINGGSVMRDLGLPDSVRLRSLIGRRVGKRRSSERPSSSLHELVWSLQKVSHDSICFERIDLPWSIGSSKSSSS